MQMSKSSPPFSDLPPLPRLPSDELIRALRHMLAAECEAVNFFAQWANETANETERRTLHDITDEERRRAGELRCLLNALSAKEISKNTP